MKKLILSLVLLILLSVALLVLAFLYIDLTGHKGARYELWKGTVPAGYIDVNRYVTEGKIIYKSSAVYTNHIGYPKVTEKLTVNKSRLTPLKFSREAEGGKGQKQTIFLEQNKETTDYLFLEFPKFLTLKGFETGEKTMVYDPYDVMLYMPVMDRYNFWKKGAQFFEIMIPTDYPIPPMRDKIRVRYIDDVFIPIMGQRTEAERYDIKARSLPDARLFISKYAHRVLQLEIPEQGLNIVLVGLTDTPAERIWSLGRRIQTMLQFKSALPVGDGKQKEVLPSESSSNGTVQRGGIEPKADGEVFINHGNLILSGMLRRSKDGGNNTGIVIVPPESPVRNGEMFLIKALVEFLSSSGFTVLTFDYPGQGKSQGSFAELDDQAKVNAVRAAVTYIKKNVDPLDSVTMIAHEDSIFVAAKTAAEDPAVDSCVFLGIPATRMEISSSQTMPRDATYLQSMLAEQGLKGFEGGFTEIVLSIMRKNVLAVLKSQDETLFATGIKLPLKRYKNFLERQPYAAILNTNKPFLLMAGKNDRDYESESIEKFRELVTAKDARNRVEAYRNIPRYMGDLRKEDEQVRFAIDDALAGAITGWISTNGKPEKKDASASEKTAEIVAASDVSVNVSSQPEESGEQSS